MSTLWRTVPIVAFDTETTGFDAFGGDRIIEFAAVVFWVDTDGRVASRSDYQTFVNPGRDVPRRITQITGIRNEDVSGAPGFEEVAETIADLLQDCIAVAHNYPFDDGFLRMEFARCGVKPPVPLAEVDTLDVSRKCFPTARRHKLGILCERLDIVLDGAHRAVNDAAVTGQAFIELLRRHRVSPELQPMLDWALALSRAPVDGPFVLDERGAAFFATGPLAGQRVDRHPLALSSVRLAREMGPSGWSWRYSEASRRWADRWLKLRGSGRAKLNPKGFRASDWVLAPCIQLKKTTLHQMESPAPTGDKDAHRPATQGVGERTDDTPLLSGLY